jgi:hypothetical protein
MTMTKEEFFDIIKTALLKKVAPLQDIGFEAKTEVFRFDDGEPYTVKLIVHRFGEEGTYEEYFNDTEKASKVEVQSVFEEWLRDHRYHVQESCYRGY